MKKEILTDELKKELAEISGMECPYYIYAFKAAAWSKHGRKHPFFYLSNGYKERFKDKPVELVRIPFTGDFHIKSRYIKDEDVACLLNFRNNNYHYLMHMWYGDSMDNEISDNIKTDWSLNPAKEYFTTELGFEMNFEWVGPYIFYFFYPFTDLHCAPFIYVSNGPRTYDLFETELVRFSTNGYPISDTDLKIPEEDLPKIRKFILANRDLIIKAWYWDYTDTYTPVILDELKEVWD